jgi:hypothetical protein
VKPKSTWVGFNTNFAEPGGCEARPKGARIYGNERVTDMVKAHSETLPAIHPGKRATRSENPANFPQQPVLQLLRRNVVKHSEGNSAGKSRVREGHCGGVAANDGDVGSVQPGAQGSGKRPIDLERGQALNLTTQQVRCEPGTRPYLENLRTQLHAAQSPRNDVLLKPSAPPG